MPYIEQADRLKLDAFADGLARNCDNVGDLTYALTRIVKGYAHRQGKSYANLSAAIAALECAKLEAYRVQLGPYEEGKRRKNGDVCCGQGCAECKDHGDTAREGW